MYRSFIVFFASLIFVLSGCVGPQHSSLTSIDDLASISLKPAEAFIENLSDGPYTLDEDVYFRRVNDDQAGVTSGFTPLVSYWLFIYVADSEGRLTPRKQTDSGRIDLKEGDLSLVVFTIIHADDGISRGEVDFRRVSDSEIAVLSYWRPDTPYRMHIFAEDADGVLHPRDRDEGFQIAVEEGDRKIVVFTYSAHEEGRLLSRDEFGL